MYLKDVSVENIISKLSNSDINKSEIALILFGEKNSPNIVELISAVNQKEINLFGGIFPGIIYEDKKYDEGAIVLTLPIVAKPYLINGLDSKEFKIPCFSEITANHSGKKYTAMILVDGLTRNISHFLSGMFNRLGNSVTYFGGGAGSLSLNQKPCLFTNEGIFQDAAIVTFIDMESNLGVRHGWENLMEPFVATSTDRNVIKELNWKNAFDVYREVVESDSGLELTKENFFSISKGYPFGISKKSSDYVVRDPISVNENGDLFCVGEIPENTVLSILKGDTKSLIGAAGLAAEESIKVDNKKINYHLIADCISRTLFLEDNFHDELMMIKKKIGTFSNDIPLVGMLTLGEISSFGDRYLEFFNKTIVSAILYE